MRKNSEALWAGSEASLHDFISAMTDAEAYNGMAQPEPEDDKPDLLEVQGGIGVISVKGPLTNRDSWFNRLVGVTSYNEIREAMIYAANKPEISQILLDIDSGGGAVSGVADTSNLIRMVNDKVKPVTAFTDGSMSSAAYWLGSSAGKVYASKTAMVGSIGVIATHMEQSEALKKAGIGVTVMRSGKYKALANGVEPLTEEAKAQMQKHLDGAYKVFVQHVAEARNVSYDLADSQMAQGREFMGDASVSAGLTDGIESYDTLFNRLSKESIDTSEKLIDNHKKSFQQELGMGKRALSEVEIAAAAEGAALAAAAEPAVTEPEAGAAAAASEDDAAAAAAAASDDGAAAAAAEAAAPAPAAEAQAGVVEYLQGQVKEKDALLLAANVELSGLKTKVDEMQAAHADLLQIAGKSVSNMQVALGGTAVDFTGMTAVQVLAEHKRVSGLFSSKFKAGGVAAVDAAQPHQSEQAVDSLTRARLAAVRISK
jgi:capsid assembly protease